MAVCAKTFDLPACLFFATIPMETDIDLNQASANTLVNILALCRDLLGSTLNEFKLAASRTQKR